MSTQIDIKTWATLQARAALLGVVLMKCDDDRGQPLFVISKWSLTRQATSLEEVEQFLRRIGGRAA